jgi:hypothetical protein
LYGTVRSPGPLYSTLPSAEVLGAEEPELATRMQRWFEVGGETGASYGQEIWTRGQPPYDPALAFRERKTEGVPEFFLSGAAESVLGADVNARSAGATAMRPKTGYALLDTFFYEGRRYGLSTTLKLIPTDRLRPIRGSEFHGFNIGADVEFPFAMVRRAGATFSDGQAAPFRAALPLSGKQRFINGVLHYETREKQWISDRDASRIEPAKKLPRWGKQGSRWIDVSIAKQTLVLYQGETPVFATLISSGEAGLAASESSTATKRGIFRIHTKHLSTTMSSSEVGEEFELHDVPHVQYFDVGGYALHAAYWHDRFGTPKSHGCINLSPEDARRIFEWTEPALP